jgi:hypothetical protein
MGLLYDYHELLTLGFVKVTQGYVKKAEPEWLCLLIIENIKASTNNY